MQNTIKLWWYSDEGNNTGDLVGPWLFDKLHIPYVFDVDKFDVSDTATHIMTCGSILNLANRNSIIGGSGFHNKTDVTMASDIRAVRGHLTRGLLNINVPVGDPGILVSKFYKPTTTKKYKFGIVSHWVDFKEFSNLNCRVINMRRDDSKTPVEDVLNDINECEFIFSSSLHGIIFAHSLGIPAIHLENSQLYSKDNFKFKDYYSVYKSVSYTKEKFNPSLDFVNTYLNEKEKYLPDKEELEVIQNNLLEVFPYEG